MCIAKKRRNATPKIRLMLSVDEAKALLQAEREWQDSLESRSEFDRDIADRAHSAAEYINAKVLITERNRYDDDENLDHD